MWLFMKNSIQALKVQDDTEMEEPKSPSDKDEIPESSSPTIQREEEHDELDMALEPA